MLAPAGGEVEDPLGLDVENSSTNFPEDQLQVCLLHCLSTDQFPVFPGDVP